LLYRQYGKILNRKVLILDLKYFLISFSFEKLSSMVATLRDAGTGMHYGGTTPRFFEMGGNGVTGVLT